MAYIQLHQSVHAHKKTLLAANKLHIDRFKMVGHLTALWAWAIDNTPDGILPDDPKAIAIAAGWEKSYVDFTGILVEVGFIDKEPGNFWHIHNWDHYAGKLIESRKKARERMDRFRNK